ADALREGIRAAAPGRAVLVREGGQIEAYERGLAHGVLVASSLEVLAHDLPPVLPAYREVPPQELPVQVVDVVHEEGSVRVVAPEPVAVRVVEPVPEPEPVVVPDPEPAPVPGPEPAAVRVLEPDVSVRIIPAARAPEPEPEPEPEPGPSDVGSDALWALLWAAKERTEAGATVPFALLEVVEGEVVEVCPPVLAAALLTADEQAGALRSALVDLAGGPTAPMRAVLAYKQGGQLVGYEPGLASGIVVQAGDLALVPVDVPNVF
ncbi:MAG: hypothetical protein JWP11_2073, partial [Frankiales bacterium]|nr:hypothetical protein [Frankiales bacterium]